MSTSAIHRNVDPEIIRESQKVFTVISGTLYTVAALALVLVMLLGIKNCCTSLFNKGKAAVSKINNHLPPPGELPSVASVEAPDGSSEWKTFDVPEDGVRVHLGRAWYVHPIGGDITITTPDGVVLHDEPGAQHVYGPQPDGFYIIRADPPGAKRQVRIKGSM